MKTGQKKKWTVGRVVKYVLLILLAVFVVKFIWGAVKPTAAKGYFNRIKSGGELEATYMALGKYATVKLEIPVDDKDVKAYEIAYPGELDNSQRTWPVVIMVNGSSDAATRHFPIFEHLASWGFVVVGNEHQATGAGESTSVMLDYILAENENPDSVFYHKLDTGHIGISGASQGACGALKAVTEFSNGPVYKTIYTASCPSPDLAEGIGWTYDATKLTIPWFMTASTGKDDAETVSPLRGLVENYENMAEGLPCVMARRQGCSHNDMQTWADGYMTAWFCWLLQGDKTAAEVFAGNSPELLSNTQNWQDVQIKNCSIDTETVGTYAPPPPTSDDVLPESNLTDLPQPPAPDGLGTTDRLED